MTDQEFEDLANRAQAAGMAYGAAAMRNVANLTPAEAAIHRAHYYEFAERKDRLDAELRRAAKERAQKEQ